MNYHILNMLDRFLQELMGNTKYMGGKLIILMHDFRQILPVVRGGGRAAVVSASVKSSDIWQHFRQISLTQNMRVKRLIQANPQRAAKLRQYANWLLQLGNGEVPSILPNNNIIEVPQSMVCDSRQALESSVYNEFRDNFNDEEYLLGRAVMSSTNEDTQECNIDMVSKIPTIDPPMISLSRDECIEDEDKGKYDVEFLNRINESGLPPHRLVLKVGACIILIRNLSIKNKHCNGTRYIILHLSPNLIKAKRLGDNGPDSIVLIPRYQLL